MAITFDTLKFVETLEAAGLARGQASAIASAVRDSHDAADTATKGDLRELEHRIETRFARVDGKLTLLHWMLAATFAMVAGIFAKLFWG